MLYVAIVIAEILFWALLLGGLLVRYRFDRPRLGGALIAGAAGATVALLAAAGADLAGGGEAQASHVIAAVAVAYSVVYGRRHLAKADAFVQRRLGRAAPSESAHGSKAERERAGWFRHARMWAIGVALLGAGMVLAGGLEERERLAGAAGVWTAILAIDFAISFSYSLQPAARRR